MCTLKNRFRGSLALPCVIAALLSLLTPAAITQAYFPSCPDFTGPSGFPEGRIDIHEVLVIITYWGATGPNIADVTGNGVVDIGDLLAVIAAWGPCP